MVKRWLGYLAVWCGCLFLHILCRQWVTQLFLITVTVLPLLSLLLSLPAIRTAKPEIFVPESCSVGEKVFVKCRLSHRFPVPAWKATFRMQNLLSGTTQSYTPAIPLPTEHCGVIRITLKKCTIYDLLGLFSFSLQKNSQFTVTVYPIAEKPHTLPSLGSDIATFWKPRPGGGFSENHELRLYRPGDELHQIHWKLSAKTGKLILREAMQQQQSAFWLLLDLTGDTPEINRKMGRFWWLGQFLTGENVTFEIHAWTGCGFYIRSVSDADALGQCLRELLEQPKATDDRVLHSVPPAVRWYLIGGNAHEDT